MSRIQSQFESVFQRKTEYINDKRRAVPMAKDKKVQWHPAFYGAMHLELKENKEELEFTEELILNTMPLRVDMQTLCGK